MDGRVQSSHAPYLPLEIVEESGLLARSVQFDRENCMECCVRRHHNNYLDSNHHAVRDYPVLKEKSKMSLEGSIDSRVIRVSVSDAGYQVSEGPHPPICFTMRHHLRVHKSIGMT